MNTSELVYEGGLRTLATHVYSGTRIFTDAPLDNKGKAQGFSPTDLVATALGCCMITIMGIEAEKLSLPLEGTKISIKKIMTINPRRIAKVEVVLEIPGKDLSAAHRQLLENAGLNCPVAKSIHPDIEQAVTFKYV